MTYVLYASGQRSIDQYPRVYVPVIPQLDYARAWLAKFLQGQTYFREDDWLYLDNGMKLRCDHLDDLLPVEDGELSQEHCQAILRFKYGTWEERPPTTKPDVDDGNEKAAPRRERSAKAHKPDGYVSITELCAASGMPACDARAILRASGRVKPAYGWCFAPSEVDAIKKLVGMGS